jgi:hypothetical protein
MLLYIQVMKHRITKEVICFTVIVASLAILQGCSDEATATPGGQSPAGNKRVGIAESDSGYSRTIAINADSLAGTCVSPNSILKTAASVNSAGQIAGVDYCYYQLGMPTGLLTAKIVNSSLTFKAWSLPPLFTVCWRKAIFSCIFSNFELYLCI